MGAVETSSQRRHLTVVMFDIVGSTALAEELDPEDVARLLSEFRSTCETRISELQGSVVNIVADEVTGCFGWPVANEASAERALRCAQAVLSDIASLRTDEGDRVALRIGIATGLVVAREARSDSVGQLREVIGTAPNLAARLQAQAQPGEIFVCSATAALVRDRFLLDPVGPLSLKGLSESSEAFLYRGEKPHSGFLPDGLPDAILLERDEQLAEIEVFWRRAMRGHGCVTIVAGEAGMGKSTLAGVFLREIEQEAGRTFVLQCSPFHKDTPLYPVSRLLRNAWGIDASLDEKTSLGRLVEALDRQGIKASDDQELIADVLNLRLGDPNPMNSGSPRLRRARTLDLLIRYIAEAAADEPVVVLVEDAHWIDPTTRELIQLAADRFKSSAVLIVLTMRPPIPDTFAALGRQIWIGPLSPSAVTALVGDMAGGRMLPATALNAIARRTDGIPLYVVELVKSLAETGKLVDAGSAFVLRDVEDEMDIPLSLSDVLNTRIDQAGESKQLLQAAACLGREFTVPLLSATTDEPVAAVLAGLSRLEQAGLIYRKARSGEATFAFRHGLVQQAAYRSLLRSRAEAIHSRIATLLPELAPGIASAHPEILARHLMAANRPADALPHYRRAGQLAAARSAYFEAVANFDRALQLVGSLADPQSRVGTEVGLLAQLGPALMALRGYADETVGRTYDRAVELLDTPQFTTADRVPALFGKWTFHVVGNRLREALEVGNRIHADAQAADDEGLVLEAHVLLGVTHFVRGSVVESVRHCRAALAIYDPDRHRAHAAIFGQEPGMAASTFLANGLWWLGDEEEALETAERAVRLAEESQHWFSRAFCAALLARLHMFRGDADRAVSFARQAAEISEAQDFPVWGATAEIFHGWIMARQSRSRNEGLATMRSGIEAYARLGSALSAPVFRARLLELELEDKDPQSALGEIAAIRRDAESSEGLCEYAEILRIEARVLERAGDPEAAERLLIDALTHTEKVQARAFAVSLALDLGENLLNAGRHQEAIALVKRHAERVRAVRSSPHLDLRVREFIERAAQHG